MRNNDIATTRLVGGSGHLPRRKFDKRCTLVSSEVLLQLCFKKFNSL